jgi:hypothetical protein
VVDNNGTKYPFFLVAGTTQSYRTEYNVWGQAVQAYPSSSGYGSIAMGSFQSPVAVGLQAGASGDASGYSSGFFGVFARMGGQFNLTFADNDVLEIMLGLEQGGVGAEISGYQEKYVLTREDYVSAVGGYSTFGRLYLPAGFRFNRVMDSDQNREALAYRWFWTGLVQLP